jgi:hypothetical protein
MHVTTVLAPRYLAMLGEEGGKDWGIQEAGMKQLDDNDSGVGRPLHGDRFQVAVGRAGVFADFKSVGRP